jgi:hypothetical protein
MEHERLQSVQMKVMISMKTMFFTMRAAVVVVVFCCASITASAYYDPGMQRWLNRDPIEEYGELNLYLVENNNPLQYFDPYGLATTSGDCKAACDAARNDPSINNGSRIGTVMCTSDGKKCPCIIGYTQDGFATGDCPEIDKVILNHEQRHIDAGNSKCDPEKKKPHPPTCTHHSNEEHMKEECELREKDIKALQEAARLSKGICKSYADAIRIRSEVWYEENCKKD